MSAERERMRQYYGRVWRKRCAGLTLEPLEQLIAEVILQHPEYQPLLEQEDYASREFLPELGETNPFLHMALHIAIREQIRADRPAGMRELFFSAQAKSDDGHAFEHQVMECLAETLWRVQREGGTPDEAAYLQCVRRIVHARGST